MNEGERREDEEIPISGKRSSTRSREMIKFFRIFTHFLATMFEENLGNRPGQTHTSVQGVRACSRRVSQSVTS